MPNDAFEAGSIPEGIWAMASVGMWAREGSALGVPSGSSPSPLIVSVEAPLCPRSAGRIVEDEGAAAVNIG